MGPPLGFEAQFDNQVCIIGCLPTGTPIEFNVKLDNLGDNIPINKEKYQRLMRKPIYLSHARLDISYVVSIVSQFMQALYEDHMEDLLLIENPSRDTTSLCGAILLLGEVLSDIHQNYEVSTKLLCVNKVAIDIANYLVQHDRAKHVEIDRHFINERLDNGSIRIPHLPSQHITDILRKDSLDKALI
ncbi:Kinesin-related protein 11 [Cucumis melo var. makuwa]|uniref:Kinesin-related protein 11 n=1 Tax=Cucumis melo var. makuwa TaxID=1194695 RepID=A0A5A7UNR5_CUCMM|nr:Kinesin-related protein 11 [Cucumis melo var. makuwa]